MDGERVLFVHAHPDDETIATGGTIALLAARGAEVTVVTCTRGELGELIAPDLVDDPLEVVRERELRGALRILGVHDHRWLGDADAHLPGTPPRRYLDSGMRWGADGRAEPLEDPALESLSAADFADVAADIATVIADVRPHAVISYDESGPYSHPDHVRTAQAARRAAEVMVVPYWSVLADGPADLEVEVSAVLDLKREALAGYRSQLVVERDRFAGANGEWQPIQPVERYRREGLEPLDGGRSRLGEGFAELGRVEKGFLLAACVLFGGLGGFLLTAAHGDVFGVIPWAAIAGLGLLAALLVGLRLAFASRVPAWVAALAFAVASIVLSLPSAGGSELVQADLPGYIWIFGSPVVIFLALVWPADGLRRPGRIGGVPAEEGPPAP